MVRTRHIQGFVNQFVSYAGITIEDRYALFYVTDIRVGEELTAAEPYMAGVLRYDLVNGSQEFVSYGPGSYIENISSAKEWIYYVDLKWEEQTAVYVLYQLDCRSMKTQEVYTLRLTDDFAENMEQSALRRAEFHGLSKRYVLVAVPEIDDSSCRKHNSGFSGYLLIDLELQEHFSVPDSIGPKDRVVHTSEVAVLEHEVEEQLVLVTGRIQAYEKREEWKRRKYDMIEGGATHSVVLIPLEAFVDRVKNNTPLDESFVIDQCDPTCGYAYISRISGAVSLYKHHFDEDTSELCLYNPVTQEMLRQRMEATYERLYLTENLRAFGIHNDGTQESIVNVSNGEILFTGEARAMVRLVNGRYASTRKYLPAKDAFLFELIDLHSKQAVHSIAGRYASYGYVAGADLHIFCG
ncbi:hypothetical protein [Paenibacillus sp. HW567]|uniref:hypothetical protein n=1 Tax=Paenibacillus sp. HW567 TaxID=1034769 RepID=UPI00037BE1F7|nr:hypothetical protein [Paenibacillus sp. HW567]